MGTLSSLSDHGALTAGDLVAIMQTVSGTRRVRRLIAERLFEWIDSLEAAGTLALADKALVHEAAASAARASTVQQLLNGINTLTALTDTTVDYSLRRTLITKAGDAYYTTGERFIDAMLNASPQETGWLAYGTSVRAGPALESFGDRDGWATTAVAASSTGVAPSATQPFCADYATSGVLNNTTSHRNSATRGLWLIRNIRYAIYLNIPTITTCRFFCGMFSTGVNRDTGDTTNSQWADTGLANVSGVGFRFSTSVPDTNWQFCTADSAGSFTFTDTTVPVAAGTMYLLEFRMTDAGTFDVWVNGRRRNAGVSNTAPTNALHRTTAGISTLAASARSWRLAAYASAQKWF